MTDRLERPGAWSSALSTNDYAACCAAGLSPVGFVQGCSVVSWNFYGFGARGLGFGMSNYQRPSGYYEQFSCPHGFVSAEHRLYGANYEKTWIEDAWFAAFRGAYERLIAEAQRVGAHGVIGIHEHTEHHPDSAAFEFSLSGTAVRMEGVEAPKTPFTTFLAGQKLNKLIEAGFAPVAIAISLVSIGVYESCITEIQMRGGGGVGWGMAPSGEVDQVSRAHEAARSLARERIREQLGGDALHAAHLSVSDRETGEGPQIEVRLRGNQVRRFKDFEVLPLPRPVVSLSDR